MQTNIDLVMKFLILWIKSWIFLINIRYCIFFSENLKSSKIWLSVKNSLNFSVNDFLFKIFTRYLRGKIFVIFLNHVQTLPTCHSVCSQNTLCTSLWSNIPKSCEYQHVPFRSTLYQLHTVSLWTWRGNLMSNYCDHWGKTWFYN